MSTLTEARKAVQHLLTHNDISTATRAELSTIDAYLDTQVAVEAVPLTNTQRAAIATLERLARGDAALSVEIDNTRRVLVGGQTLAELKAMITPDASRFKASATADQAATMGDTGGIL